MILLAPVFYTAIRINQTTNYIKYSHIVFPRDSNSLLRSGADEARGTWYYIDARLR